MQFDAESTAESKAESKAGAPDSHLITRIILHVYKTFIGISLHTYKQAWDIYCTYWRDENTGGIETHVIQLLWSFLNS